MGRKILIISSVIFPRRSPRSLRATELAKELSRQGHDVTIYAKLGNYNYKEFQKINNITVKDIGKLYFSLINSDVNPPKNIVSHILRRFLYRLLEFPDIELMFKIPKIIDSESDVDLLISIAVPYPIHWGCALSRSRRKKSFPSTWAADCGDPYMGDKENKKYFYFRYLEKWFCRKADYIVIPFEGAKPAYYSEFAHKIKVIPQGFNFEESREFLGKPNNLIPTFAYAGVFYKDIRNPSNFLRYLVKLDIEFKFIVFTSTKELITPFQDLLKNKLEIHEYIPRERLIFELSKMDFLVNFENRGAFNSPSKLIDYALTKRPILSISNSLIRSEIVNEFLSGNYQNQYIVEDIQQYEISKVVSEFCKMCKEK